MRKEIKEAVKLLKESKDELSLFVKDFLENQQPIIRMEYSVGEDIEYKIETVKWGEVKITFFSKKEPESSKYMYSIECAELDFDFIPSADKMAHCNVYICCSKYKIGALKKEYERTS